MGDRLVYVEWLDAYGCSPSWAEIKDIKPAPLVCRSVGWLLYDEDDCKVIVPHRSQDGHDHADPQGCGDMTILTVAITRLVDLKVPRK